MRDLLAWLLLLGCVVVLMLAPFAAALWGGISFAILVGLGLAAALYLWVRVQDELGSVYIAAIGMCLVVVGLGAGIIARLVT